MRIPTRLYKRSDTYYYRRRAPLSIARLTNRADYKYCLRVTNMKAARELSLMVDHILDCAFIEMNDDEIRKQGEKAALELVENLDKISDEKVRHYITKSYYSTAKTALEAARMHIKQMREAKDNIRTHEDKNRELDRKNISLEREILERDKTQIDNGPHQKLKHIKLEEAINSHLEWEKSKGLDYKTIKKKELSLFYMHQILGDKYAHQVDTDDAEKVTLLVRQLPTNMEKSLRTNDILKGIELNKSRGLPTISPKTAGDGYITYMSRFFNEMVRKNATWRNPFATLASQVADGANEQLREPVTIDQLNRLFSHEFFDEKWEIHQWMFVLAILTGARTNELLQLKCSDIVTKYDRPHFFIVKRLSDEDKSLKTKNSKRFVPFHKILMDLGFIDYVNQQKEAGHDRIFHQAKSPKNPKVNYSNDYSKKINPILKRVLGKEDEYGPIVYYRLRHTFIELMRESGIDINHQYYFEGHTNSHISGRYGRKSDISEFMTNSFDNINFNKIEALTKHIKKASARP
ncbi:tyrosine-type recombinase/integrase [Thalassospira lucentensis]|uniref:tyrosine-type recombinase/integrase n=1 Tax=Thalassospira lucentensis TaxID=168935 RepID=UPI003D2BAA5B